MPKFTPTVEPKNPVLYDISSKKHISFDNSDSENEEPVPKRAKLNSTKDSKNKTNVKKTITKSAKNDSKEKKSVAIKKGKKSAAIEIPNVKEMGKLHRVFSVYSAESRLTYTFFQTCQSQLVVQSRQVQRQYKMQCY
jgi:hypothetical protein